MQKNSLSDTLNIKLAILSSICIIVLLVLIGIIYKTHNRDYAGAVKRTIEMNDLISQIRIDLLKSSEFEKSAVMADSDELSKQFANKAIALNDEVEKIRQELVQLVYSNGSSNELRLMNDFSICWDNSRKIDNELLEFAVENTNIKASSLSTTKGIAVLSIFENSLLTIITNNSGSDNNSIITKLAFEALVAAFKIEYLHTPHISSANDSNMDMIENSIKGLDETVRNALNRLSGFVSNDTQPLLRDAVSAYDHFMVVTAEVFRLSRQNTNIRSFELSLGRKRKVTAECDDILNGLQELVRGKTFEATR